MKFISILLLLLFTSLAATAQRYKNPCIYEHLLQEKYQEDLIKRYGPVYDFHKGDAVASVGAGSGSKEVVYSMMADSLTFYLQDIKSACLTPEIIESTVSQLYSVANRPRTADFVSVIGTEKETKLPIAFFDKIIMENTMHELTYPKDLLASIRANLKPGGYLYIEDFIAEKPGQKHRGCKKILFTEKALIQLLEESGFHFVEVTSIFPKNLEDRVYKFIVME